MLLQWEKGVDCEKNNYSVEWTAESPQDGIVELSLMMQQNRFILNPLLSLMKMVHLVVFLHSALKKEHTQKHKQLLFLLEREASKCSIQ